MASREVRLIIERPRQLAGAGIRRAGGGAPARAESPAPAEANPLRRSAPTVCQLDLVQQSDVIASALGPHQRSPCRRLHIGGVPAARASMPVLPASNPRLPVSVGFCDSDVEPGVRVGPDPLFHRTSKETTSSCRTAAEWCADAGIAAKPSSNAAIRRKSG